MHINFLVGLIVISIIVTNYYTFNKNLDTIIKEKEPEYIYNPEIRRILKKIKKYKKISLYNYKKGIEYWAQFIKHVTMLDDPKLKNYNLYFDNAYHYLVSSVNMFNSLGVSSYDRKYIDGMKYGDYQSSKDMKNITELCKELYKEGYSLLYNISLKLNKRWKQNVNNHNKEIVLDYPQPRDLKSTSYDFFL
tara:strand:+ start:1044 stop:1616 length:573 start_codon:yes stop_codon:yes gene_type:complete